MGDVVLTGKIFRNLKINYPKSEIVFITKQEYLEILENNPYIDLIQPYIKNSPTNITALKNKILEFNPDIVIDLQCNKRSKFLTVGLRAHIYSFNKRRLFKMSLVYAKLHKKEAFEAIPDLYCQAYSNPDFICDDKGIELWLKSDSYTYKPFTRQYNKKDKYTISIAPAAHFKTKRWAEEDFIELINIIKYDINADFILLGGADDNELCSRISYKTGAVNFAGKLNIIQTAQKIDQSDLIITNDTGLMHIASARRTPSVVIYGSTVQNFGFIPYQSPSLIIEENIWCRPCSHIGRNFCPLLHFKCMKNIKPLSVKIKILSFFNYLYNIDKN